MRDALRNMIAHVLAGPGSSQVFLFTGGFI